MEEHETDLEVLLEREGEMKALLASSRAVFHCHDFEEAAGEIFTSCKGLIGATAGYVALMTADGTENDVVYLDSGGRDCLVDPDLPMPIRELREAACRTGKAVYENNFWQSEWKEFLPPGHVILENVLFAPLLLEEKTVGLLGLGNKPGGFTDHDARRATSFGEHGAVALRKFRIMERLKMQEEQYRNLVESAQDGIISIDEEGKVRFWNRAANRLFGYRAEELKGQSMICLIPERYRQDHEDGLKRLREGGMARIIGSTIQTSGLRKDGSEFPLELSLSRSTTGTGPIYTAIIRDVSDRKIYEKLQDEQKSILEEKVRERTCELALANQSLSLSRKELRKLHGHLQSAVEEERARMAREIHDQLGQTLTALKLDLAWLKKKVSPEESAMAGRVEVMDHLLSEMLQTVRKISTELRPGMLDDLGLVAAMSGLAGEMEMHTGVQCRVVAEPENPVIDGEVSTVLYRIFQEALTNVIRHAGASRVEAFLKEEESALLLQLSDDGRGITPQEVSGMNSFGLLGIRERVRALGGTMEIQGKENQGTTLAVRIPLQEVL